MPHPDTSRAEALDALLADKRKHEGYLARLEERRATTPAHLFDRLYAEYHGRLAALRERAQAEAAALADGLAEDEAAVVEVEARVGEEGGPAGRRREHFEPDLELRKLARRWLEQRLARQLQSGRTRLQAVRQALPATDPADAKRLKARVKSLETWHGKGRALVPVMKTFLQLT